MSEPQFLPQLEKGLWRRIGKNGMISVTECGYILPSDIRNKKTWRSYAQRKGYVSLFDFSQLEKFREIKPGQDSNWLTLLKDKRPATIILKLDRSVLKSKLKSWEQIRSDWEKDRTCNLIPHIEAFYPERISAKYISGCILTCYQNHHIYETIDHELKPEEILEAYEFFVVRNCINK